MTIISPIAQPAHYQLLIDHVLSIHHWKIDFVAAMGNNGMCIEWELI